MTDKIVTVDKCQLGYCIARVSDEEQAKVLLVLKLILELEGE